MPNVNREQFGQLALPGMELGTRAKPFVPKPHAHVAGDLLRGAASWRQNRYKFPDWSPEEQVDSDVAHGRPAINFDSGAMDAIASTVGEFHNQHVVRRSNGTLNPEYRAQYERKAFGYDEGSDPRNEHPVYGYLHNPRRSPSTVGLGGPYGNVRAVLKPEVLDRTTLTAGDSLGQSVPMPHRLVAEGKAPRLFYSHADPAMYTEAQYHGSVSWDDDVSHVEFRDDDYDAEHIKAIANETGKPWRSMRQVTTTQPFIPVHRTEEQARDLRRALQNEMGLSAVEKDGRVQRMVMMEDRAAWGQSAPFEKKTRHEEEVERSKGFKTPYHAERTQKLGEQWR